MTSTFDKNQEQVIQKLVEYCESLITETIEPSIRKEYARLRTQEDTGGVISDSQGTTLPEDKEGVPETTVTTYDYYPHTFETFVSSLIERRDIHEKVDGSYYPMKVERWAWYDKDTIVMNYIRCNQKITELIRNKEVETIHPQANFYHAIPVTKVYEK